MSGLFNNIGVSQNQIQMHKTAILTLLLVIAFISCKRSDKEIDTVEIAKKYYDALDNSDASAMAVLLTDSLVTKETAYDYEQTFSRSEYLEWVKWDSVFDPTYEILQIDQKDEYIKAKISKIDKRISFLHEEPIVTNQLIRFDQDKIVSVETTEYVVFNDTTFVKNRESLLSWIDENHPELNGFIYNQTAPGGRQYLKAIELYTNQQ
jgi:hypothetical protein